MIPAALVPCPRCGGEHRLAGEPLPGQTDWDAPIRYAADEICALCDVHGKVQVGTRCECYLAGGGEAKTCDWCGKNYRPQLSTAPCQHEIPDNPRQYDARWSFCSEECSHVELHNQFAGACARCDSLAAEMEQERLAGLISRTSPGATPGSATTSTSAADEGGSAAGAVLVAASTATANSESGHRTAS